MVGKYRKKPVTVEAIQFTGGSENFYEIEEWVSENWPEVEIDLIHGRMRGELETLIIKVSNCSELNNYCSEWDLDLFDWLVKGVDGSLYPVKDDTFRKVYEMPTTEDIKENDDVIVW